MISALFPSHDRELKDVHVLWTAVGQGGLSRVGASVKEVDCAGRRHWFGSLRPCLGPRNLDTGSDSAS